MWRKQQSEESSLPAEQPFAHPVAGAPPSSAEASPSSRQILHAPRASGAVSCLTEGLRFKGEIEGREDLHIHGRLECTIRLSGATAVVGPRGQVTGDIEAREIVIEGSVRGGLRALERVRVAGTGVVFGDIVTARLLVEEGARLRGAIDMGDREQTRPGSSTQISSEEPAAAAVMLRARSSSE